MSKEKLKIGYSRLTEAWYYTGGRTKVDITEEIEAVLEDKNKRIADLEAKLAEKESEVKVGEFWHSAYQGKQLDCDKIYAELRQSYDENEQLKQQLVDKEEDLKATTESLYASREYLEELKSAKWKLEEQLKNAIVPKFKFMEKVYHINKDYFYKKDWFVAELLINGFEYKIDKRKNSLVMWYSTYFNDYKNYKYQEKDLFTTKEEAELKLKELKGE